MDYEYDDRFAARCKALRDLRRMSQSQLARQTGIHQSAVSKIESRERHVGLSEAMRIAAALRVDLLEMVSVGEIHVAVIR